MRKYFLFGAILVLMLVVGYITWKPFQWPIALVVAPLLIWGCIDFFQKKDNVRRSYPVFGSISRFLESQKHVVQELILLARDEGKPFNQIQKEIVQKRADDENMTQPFGTDLLYSEPGREWFQHVAFPAKEVNDEFRVMIGGPFCRQPYSSSILNIGAMSFGSISKNAVMALNGGAKKGGFAQNTGEGGLTKYHQKYGADLIFQFGTGYFGCRDDAGNFSEEKFIDIATNELVKMVEIKISQGAKPGFGALLPARKNTAEIAKYRNIEPHTLIQSPAFHSAFSNPIELITFIARLRELSGGKPVGIKLCVGLLSDMDALISTFAEQGNYPDFITIDGAEGGSGAAHLESLHWVGMPLYDALHFVNKTLITYRLRDKIKIMAAGKIISSFDIAKALTLGADTCYTSRGMMFALGCVQSLKCNLDTCPTGITTMDKSRVASLVVDNKMTKVANYHRNTLQGFKDLLASAGLENRNGLRKELFMKRIDAERVVSFETLYS